MKSSSRGICYRFGVQLQGPAIKGKLSIGMCSSTVFQSVFSTVNKIPQLLHTGRHSTELEKPPLDSCLKWQNAQIRAHLTQM